MQAKIRKFGNKINTKYRQHDYILLQLIRLTIEQRAAIHPMQPHAQSATHSSCRLIVPESGSESAESAAAAMIAIMPYVYIHSCCTVSDSISISITACTLLCLFNIRILCGVMAAV
jgi:hypothetical protein